MSRKIREWLADVVSVFATRFKDHGSGNISWADGNNCSSEWHCLVPYSILTCISPLFNFFWLTAWFNTTKWPSDRWPLALSLDMLPHHPLGKSGRLKATARRSLAVQWNCVFAILPICGILFLCGYLSLCGFPYVFFVFPYVFLLLWGWCVYLSGRLHVHVVWCACMYRFNFINLTLSFCCCRHGRVGRVG
jgi:hypothetical protein